MFYLLDTNVISEFRKQHKADAGVRNFFAHADEEALFLPAQAIGEISAGIARLMRRGGREERERASAYAAWLGRLEEHFRDRILDFDHDCAHIWGHLLGHDKKDPHTIDKQIAAIALMHDMTVVTRDKGQAFSAVPNLKLLNPFTPQP